MAPNFQGQLVPSDKKKKSSHDFWQQREEECTILRFNHSDLARRRIYTRPEKKTVKKRRKKPVQSKGKCTVCNSSPRECWVNAPVHGCRGGGPREGASSNGLRCVTHGGDPVPSDNGLPSGHLRLAISLRLARAALLRGIKEQEFGENYRF